MKISSPEFKQNEFIPKKFTCLGKNINPTLFFDDIPDDAKSLVLIMEDPDAVGALFVHWIVYNIAIIKKIEENSKVGIEGLNTLKKIGYIGPCPPEGTGKHRYFFKIFALDVKLKIDGKVDKVILEKAMDKHIIDSAELIGIFSKDQ